MENHGGVPQDDEVRLAGLHERLAEGIGRRTVGKEDCSTAIPNLALFRRDSPTQASACKVEPSLVIVAQGAKQLLVGDHSYSYDTRRFLINEPPRLSWRLLGLSKGR